MVYDDLEFTIMNDNYEIVYCDIISIIPNEENEFYVIFTDNTKDDLGNVILKYGRLVKIEDRYELKNGIDDYELEYIKTKFNEDLVELANLIIESN